MPWFTIATLEVAGVGPQPVQQPVWPAVAAGAAGCLGGPDEAAAHWHDATTACLRGYAPP